MQCVTMDWTWIREKYFIIKNIIGQLAKFEYGQYYIYIYMYTRQREHANAVKY